MNSNKCLIVLKSVHDIFTVSLHTLTLFSHHSLTETLYFVDNMEWNADEDVDDEQLLHAVDDVERTMAQVDTISNVNINTPSTHSQCFSLQFCISL